MELTLYDKNGKPVAYLTEKMEIYAFSGEILAFIDDDSVYSFSGSHLGWFIDYWIIDHDGYYFLYTEKSTGGPYKPYRHYTPYKSFKKYRPHVGYKQHKPYKKSRKIAWSSLSLSNFFKN